MLSPLDHQPTGKTKHFKGDREIPAPHSLQIVRYPNDRGYYLLYLDENGNELTDTYHDRLQGAIEQANWEFSVQPEEWEFVEVEADDNCQGDDRDRSDSRMLANRLREQLNKTSTSHRS